MKTWKKRYVILSGNVLYYFKSPKDKEPLGFVPLENIEARASPLTPVHSYLAVHASVFTLPSSHQVRFNPKQPNFALVPSRGALMKSVRAAGKSASFVHGHHKMFNFKAESVETMKKWVQSVKDHAVELQSTQYSAGGTSKFGMGGSRATRPDEPAFLGKESRV